MRVSAVQVRELPSGNAPAETPGRFHVRVVGERRPEQGDAAPTARLAAMAADAPSVGRGLGPRRTPRPLGRPALPLVLALALAIVTAAVAAGFTGPVGENQFGSAAMAWLRSGSSALLWLAMSIGLGSPLVAWLGLERRSELERLALVAALGMAAGLVLDAALGSLGLLVAFRGGGAWVLTFVGLGLLVWRWRRGEMQPPLVRAPLVAIAIGPALGILLVAAASEPGWLWASEFGGYDALSYHLQLPKEWLVRGVSLTLPHNVYSGFPSYVENAFLHVFILAGGHEPGGVAAQMLAVVATLVAALNVAALGRRVGGTLGAALAAVLYLGTPWVVVVGSLAYNDGFVPLFLAAGLLVATKPPASERKASLAFGLLLAAACGAKLTAVGFAVLPLFAVALLHGRGRGVRILLGASLVTGLLLAPWWLRNLLLTGNPTYPFFAGVFPVEAGWPWSAEQATIFAKAHSADLSFGERLVRLVDLFFRFGFGANPHPGEPWAPQWSLLPILGTLAIAAGTLARPTRPWALLCGVTLLLQLGFWLGATHLQSRFLLPAAVPLAVACAALTRRVPRTMAQKALTTAGLAWSLVTVWIFHDFGHRSIDPSGRSTSDSALAIGHRDIMTGEFLAALDPASLASDTERQALLAARRQSLVYLLNFELPKDDLLVLVGDATPFWYRRLLPYSTVFDRGILDQVAMADPEHPEAWGRALADAGVRFVVINEPMLKRWHESGWLNPAITAERLGRFAQSSGRMVVVSPGVALIDLRPPAPPPTGTTPPPSGG